MAQQPTGLLVTLPAEDRMTTPVSSAATICTISFDTMVAALGATFGPFATEMKFGKPSPVLCPPFIHPDEIGTFFKNHYKSGLTQAMTAFKEGFISTDKSRYRAAKRLDEDAYDNFGFMHDDSTDISSMSGEQIAQFYEKVVNINHSYTINSFTKPNWFQVGSASFLARANHFTSGVPQSLGIDQELQDKIRDLESAGRIVEEQAMELSAANRERRTDTVPAARPPTSNHIEAHLGDSDYGVSAYVYENKRPWDSWTCLEHLGLDGYQDEQSIQLANEMSPEDAHLYEIDENGEPILDPVTGEMIFVNPDHHRARTVIRFPYLAQFSPDPRDLVGWELKVNATRGVVPKTDATHDRQYPSSHQLITLCRIMDLGYANHPSIQSLSVQYLADAVGLGKTLTFILLTALLRYYESNPTLRAPCQAAVKRYLLPADMPEAEKDKIIR